MVVETPSGVLTGADLPGRQGREVLALFGTRVETPLARTAIAEELWGPARPPSWDAALSAIVSKLRGALAGVGLEGNSTIRASDGCYLLHLPSDGWIDHAAAGNSAEAMSVYESCRRRIANEPGVAPSPETRELHASILRSL